MALAKGSERVAFVALIWIFLGKCRIQTLIRPDLSKHKTCRRRGGGKIQRSLESHPSFILNVVGGGGGGPPQLTEGERRAERVRLVVHRKPVCSAHL